MTLLAILKIVLCFLWLAIGVLFALAAKEPAGGTIATVFAVLALGMAAACGVCAYGLWRLRTYGRVLQIALSGIGLLIGFPIGSVVSVLIIIYMLSPGIRILFSGRAPETLSRDEADQLRAVAKMSPATVIVVAAVLAVLIIPMTGIVAAIAIPNFLNAMDRGKQKRTMADVRAIAAAVEAYANDHHEYPVAESIDDLAEQLVPTYISSMPKLDGWAHRLQVTSTEVSYTIYSFGKDGTGSSCEPAETNSFNDEICMIDGTFVHYPAGSR